MKTVIVAGCGGNLGISIARILRMSGISFRLIGTDIHDDHPGAAIYDQCHVIPPVCSGPEYVKSLLTIADANKASAIIPISEGEIKFFSIEINRSMIKNYPLIMANDNSLSIGYDKYRTAMFLKEIGLPYPWTIPFEQGKPLRFPCILKPRFGSGSNGFQIVRDHENVHDMDHSNYVWQEFLDNPDKEFTCGLFRSRTGEIRSIILRRYLSGDGMTSRGEVVNDVSIANLLARIAEGLLLRGSINVQLRVGSNGPVVFEINPRFSSTVVFRHLLGFRDVLWCLFDAWDMRLKEYTEPLNHTKFYRIAQEILIGPNG